MVVGRRRAHPGGRGDVLDPGPCPAARGERRVGRIQQRPARSVALRGRGAGARILRMGVAWRNHCTQRNQFGPKYP
ncbi:hypothetical protein ACFPM0_08310 [Pseudonocardia sulfidoxydans]|uniref:hypothetical protein n=1 Tax=Pseudonocardia sulfidoxydans TaxID=54011 RepID=UPI00361B00EC